MGLSSGRLTHEVRPQGAAHVPFIRQATANGSLSILRTRTSDPMETFFFSEAAIQSANLQEQFWVILVMREFRSCRRDLPVTMSSPRQGQHSGSDEI